MVRQKSVLRWRIVPPILLAFLIAAPVVHGQGWYNIVEISCTGPACGGFFTFSLTPPLPTPPCDPIVYCEVMCEMCIFIGPCPIAVDCIRMHIIDCINTFGQGWSAEPIGLGLLRVEGPAPFDECIWSTEMTALPPGAGLPLTPECPVNNICNGEYDDEQMPHANGFGFHVIEEGPVVTPTATPTATPTETATPTATVTPTERAVWYNVVEISCLEPLSGGLFTFSVTPQLPAPPCEPMPCDPLVFCEVICDTCELEPCSIAVECIRMQIIDCVNNFGQGWSAEPVGPDLIRIEGPVPFDKCIWAWEIMVSPGSGLPLTLGCDVNNMCNGESGDELLPHINGLSFHVHEEGEIPTLTPTNTPVFRTGTNGGKWRLYR